MRLDRKLAGKFGDYSCDSPWALIESAARAMRSKHGDIEFVLWTGYVELSYNCRLMWSNTYFSTRIIV